MNGIVYNEKPQHARPIYQNAFLVIMIDELDFLIHVETYKWEFVCFRKACICAECKEPPRST